MKFGSLINDKSSTHFGKRSVWLFLAKLFPALAFLLVTILYSRQLSLNDYGIFQTAWMLINFNVIVLGFGIYSVLLSAGFFSVFQLISNNKWQVTAFYLLLSTIITFIVFSTENLSIVTLLIVIFLICLLSVSFVLEAILINNKKEGYVFTGNFFYAVLFFSWHYHSLVSDFNINYLMSGIAGLALIRIFYYLVISKPLFKSGNDRQVSLQHWFLIGTNEVIGIAAKWMDKLILVYFLAPGEFAIFFNGSIEIPIFGILISVIGSLLLVDVAANLVDKPKVVSIYKDTFRLLSSVVLPLFMFFFFFREELFSVILNKKYHASVEIFMFSLLIVPVRISHYSAILQCYNKASLILKGAVIDIVIALCLMPVFYILLGLKGVALAIVVSTYIQSWFYLHHTAKVLETNIRQLVPFKIILSRLIILGLLFWVCQIALTSLNDVVTLFTSAFITAFVILFYLRNYYKAALQLNVP